MCSSTVAIVAPSWRAISLGASVARSRRRCRPQARRFNPGFYFGFGGFGKLLLLLRLAFGRWQRRPAKSGGPPLFEPSLKVQGYTAHNRNSGSRSCPRVTTSTLTASERFRAGSAAGVHALAPIGRHMTGKQISDSPTGFLESRRVIGCQACRQRGKDHALTSPVRRVEFD
jgi:hypothetical protein